LWATPPFGWPPGGFGVSIKPLQVMPHKDSLLFYFGWIVRLNHGV
jgi:hypothetical protein